MVRYSGLVSFGAPPSLTRVAPHPRVVPQRVVPAQPRDQLDERRGAHALVPVERPREKYLPVQPGGRLRCEFISQNVLIRWF